MNTFDLVLYNYGDKMHWISKGLFVLFLQLLGLLDKNINVLEFICLYLKGI